MARRRVPLSELEYPDTAENKRVDAVIQRLVEVRLIVRGQEPGGELYIEPAHDALVQGWDKIQTWKKQEQENLALQRLLTPAAREWISNKKAGGFLWDDNPRILLLKQVLESGNNWLNELETKFVHASLQRRRNNRHRLIGATAGVIVSLAGLSIFALIQLQFSTLREKAATVRNQLSTEPLNSLILAIQATGESASRLRQVPSPIQFSLSSAVAESREQTVIRGHKGAVLSVAFSSDGRTIVSGGEDGTVRLWDSTGKSVAVLKGHEERVDESGNREGNVNSVTFSPNGQIIASGGSDGTVRLWDLQGNQIALMKEHKERISSVAFSPDGNEIVSSSQDGIVLLWNLQNGFIQSLASEKKTVGRSPIAAFSPDSQMVAGILHGELILWNLEGKILGRTSVSTRGNADSCSLAFSLDKTDPSYPLFSVLTGQCHGPGTLPVFGYEVQRRVIEPEKKSIDQVGETYSGHEGEVLSIATSIEGIVASGSTDNTIRLWRSTANPPPVSILRGHTGAVNEVAFSPNGKQLVSASEDGTIRLWDLVSFLNTSNIDFSTIRFRGKVVQNYDVYNFVYSVAFNPPKGELFAVAFRNTLLLYNIQGELVVPPFKGHEGDINSVAFSPDGSKIVSGSADKTLRLWDLNGNSLGIFKGHEDHVNSVAFSPDGSKIVSGSADKTLRLWDLSGNSLGIFKGHQESINSVAFSPDDTKIVSGSDDTTIRSWDLQGNLLHIFRGHEQKVLSVAFSPDSKMIVSGGNDKVLHLWELEGNPIDATLIRGHSGPVESVAFSPKGNMIVSASTDRTVMFSGLDGSPLAPTFTGTNLPILYSVMAISPDGNTLLLSMGGSAKEFPSGLSIVKGWSDWQVWLRTACDRLRYYPALVNPQTDIEKGAKSTCQSYAWNQ